MDPALKVGAEVGRGVKIELFGEIIADVRGDVLGIVDKRPQKPHGAELHGTAPLGLRLPKRAQKSAIRIVQKKVLGQLGRRGLSRIPAVLGRLLRGQKIDRHRHPSLRNRVPQRLTWVDPAETSYKARVVAVSGVSYVCLINHTGTGAKTP